MGTRPIPETWGDLDYQRREAEGRALAAEAERDNAVAIKDDMREQMTKAVEVMEQWHDRALAADLHAERLRAALGAVEHALAAAQAYVVPGTQTGRAVDEAKDVTRRTLAATTPTAEVETLREAIRVVVETRYTDFETLHAAIDALARAATALGLI